MRLDRGLATVVTQDLSPNRCAKMRVPFARRSAAVVGQDLNELWRTVGAKAAFNGLGQNVAHALSAGPSRVDGAPGDDLAALSIDQESRPDDIAVPADILRDGVTRLTSVTAPLSRRHCRRRAPVCANDTTAGGLRHCGGQRRKCSRPY